MELISSLVTNARRVMLNGRSFVVADVISLREGVLQGSKGPLFYPAAEIAKYPGMWNGMPVTAGHPHDGEKARSARSPDMWAKHYIGFVFNDRYEDDRTRPAEVWIDEEVADRVDNRIVKAIMGGKSIEVSTGLFTEDEPTKGTYNGVDYTHIARNYRADHLAILMDDRGACGVKDGCGININSEAPMERPALVSWLTTNCGCWKGKEKVLENKEAFTDADLEKLKSNAETLTLTVNTLKQIGATVKAPADAKISDLPGIVANAFEKKDDEDEDEDEDEEDEDMKKNQLKKLLGSLTENERFDLIATPQMKEYVATSKEIHDKEVIATINKLTEHIADPATRKKQILKLRGKKLAELRDLVELMPTSNAAPAPKDDEESFLRNFFASGGTNNAGAGDVKTDSKGDDTLAPCINIFDTEEEVA